ncbi:N-formylglutamate amidohydrolase [Stenotrophobium rhamnosiphilum]|uniref:N-formylglutamate amidohydrolase n=1 Tax=Stenotrophobium rhamnosiphilum TaxID=2029166 RepID=A0A2T5MBD2_9GAMM|nr:N-formylglutamate amidohydrolase [Stenotrophobium rhamnosiphilum]PTU28288.1 N-formylglutamate amidohydrolase [Stenotrophobium rhamnosiphilum]
MTLRTDDSANEPLLGAHEPQPIRVENAAGQSAYFLICDHAGTRIPEKLDSLGLPEAEVQRHIGWDIGAAALALKLADKLDATVILQPYSRLVIDCNRPLNSPDSIAKISERTLIPGNQHISKNDAQKRRDEIFTPYHRRIREELDSRESRGQAMVLIAVHSFTPVYLDQKRPWHVGVLYNRDARLAHLLSAALRAEEDLVVGENEPYSVSDETDYTVPEYGERRKIPHVEIEIRQDLIADEIGQEAWALRLTRLLKTLVEPLKLL